MSMFHFLRPEWFWALIPAAALGWLLLKNRAAAGSEGWARHVDSHLLRHLAMRGVQAGRRSWKLPLAGGLMVLATIVALAGPTWQRAEMPSFDGGEPVVAVLSLAQSMNADDLRPTRLKRAIHKLRDILARTQGDDRALVIYADAPFVAAPLTNDAQVIEQMLPELSTSLMPVLGNRLDLAIAEAVDVLHRAGAAQGRIVVLADDAGNDPEASIAAARAVRAAGYSLSVLGVGTEAGATLQTADGRAITNRDGQTYQTALAASDLQQVADAGGGVVAMVSPGNADLDRILPRDMGGQPAGEHQDFKADAWQDMGYWLLIVPVLLLPFAFRRGLVFGMGLLAFGLMQPQGAQAGVWDDLWATPDQQGQAAFDADEYGKAADLFDTAQWQGAAAYRAGDYAEAARDFTGDDYNRGNALARSGELEAALAAYDRALATDPGDADAQFNRDLVARLLQQQQAEPEQPQDPQGGEDEQPQGDQDQQGQQGDPQDGQDQKGNPQGGQDQEGDEGGEPQDQDGQTQQQGQDGQPQDQPSSNEQDPSEQAPQDGTGQQEEQPGDAPSAQDRQGQQTAPSAEEQTGEPAQDQAAEQGSGMAERLAEALTGTDETPQAEASAPGAQPLDQAIEQQLRRVPDDPSGLLRARIRQHYLRMGARN